MSNPLTLVKSGLYTEPVIPTQNEMRHVQREKLIPSTGADYSQIKAGNPSLARFPTNVVSDSVYCVVGLMLTKEDGTVVDEFDNTDPTTYLGLKESIGHHIFSEVELLNAKETTVLRMTTDADRVCNDLIQHLRTNKDWLASEGHLDLTTDEAGLPVYAQSGMNPDFPLGNAMAIASHAAPIMIPFRIPGLSGFFDQKVVIRQPFTIRFKRCRDEALVSWAATVLAGFKLTITSIAFYYDRVIQEEVSALSNTFTYGPLRQLECRDSIITATEKNWIQDIRCDRRPRRVFVFIRPTEHELLYHHTSHHNTLISAKMTWSSENTTITIPCSSDDTYKFDGVFDQSSIEAVKAYKELVHCEGLNNSWLTFPKWGAAVNKMPFFCLAFDFTKDKSNAQFDMSDLSGSLQSRGQLLVDLRFSGASPQKEATIYLAIEQENVLKADATTFIETHF